MSAAYTQPTSGLATSGLATSGVATSGVATSSVASPELADAERALAVSDGARVLPMATLFNRGTDDLIVLRNSGGKPLRVQGILIAEGSSRGAQSTAWHEVAIYRVATGGVAVAIRFLGVSASACGVHRARLFDSTDAACAWLESFEPAFDLGADFDVSDARASSAAVSLKAAALRDRAERLEREYRALVGEVLFRLETE
jgi:hypothetical protein